MQDEKIFSPEDTVVSSLSRISSELSLLEEERICELAELAEEAAEATMPLFQAGMTGIEVLSLLSDEGLLKREDEKDGEKEALFHLNSFGKLITSADRAYFSELYLLRLRRLGISLSESDFLPEYSGGEELVYLRNAFADEAFEVFSQDLNDPRVRYSGSLRDAAARVAEGDGDYCLLPLEERGSRLQAVAELIFRHDLKIDMVTPVFGFDGSADMKYAACSKGFRIPLLRADDDRYLEIRLPADAEPISEVLIASEALGLSIYRISSASFDTEDGRRQYFSLVLRDEGREFTSFLAYLTLFSRGFGAVGIYKNLE